MNNILATFKNVCVYKKMPMPRTTGVGNLKYFVCTQEICGESFYDADWVLMAQERYESF